MPITDANSLIWKIDDLVGAVIWLLISLAVIFIVWNAIQFIRNAGGEKRKEYQNAVLWGIVGLFVILSIWGLVYVLSNTLNVDNESGNWQGQYNVENLILRRPATGGATNPASTGAGGFNPATNPITRPAQSSAPSGGATSPAATPDPYDPANSPDQGID